MRSIPMNAVVIGQGSSSRLLVLSIILLLALTCRAQTQQAVDSIVQAMVVQELVEEETPEPAYVRLDTMLPEQQAHNFSEAELEALRNDQRYQYEREVSQAPSAWDRFWDMVGDRIDAILKRLEDMTGLRLVEWFWEYIWFIVFAVALVIAVIALRGRVFSKVFARTAAEAGAVRTLEEDITADDLPDQLADAERMGEWRKALRLQYLLVLRYLVDEGRISWKPQHTDRDYQAQLKDEDERLRFGRLSFIFKWVWYGEATLDRGQYERLSVAFMDFRSKRAA
jgi:hypothetical protein